MLNYQYKAAAKLISLILAQVFLLTSVVYPESTTNKITSSIYIQAKDLRVPMMGGGNNNRFGDAINRMNETKKEPPTAKSDAKGSPLTLLKYLIAHKNYRGNPISMEDLRKVRINRETGWSYADSTIYLEINSLKEIGMLESVDKGRYALSEEFTMDQIAFIDKEIEKIIASNNPEGTPLGLNRYRLDDLGDKKIEAMREVVTGVIKNIEKGRRAFKEGELFYLGDKEVSLEQLMPLVDAIEGSLDKINDSDLDPRDIKDKALLKRGLAIDAGGYSPDHPGERHLDIVIKDDLGGAVAKIKIWPLKLRDGVSFNKKAVFMEWFGIDREWMKGKGANGQALYSALSKLLYELGYREIYGYRNQGSEGFWGRMGWGPSSAKIYIPGKAGFYIEKPDSVKGHCPTIVELYRGIIESFAEKPITSESPASNQSMPRRTFLSKSAKAIAGATVAAAAGAVAYKSGEPSREQTDAIVFLKRPMHTGRYASELQFEQEKEAFIAAKSAKDNLLGKEDTEKVRGFLTPGRIKAIKFAAERWKLEPALIAGFAYEEKVDKDSKNSVKEGIKERISKMFGLSDMRNTTGLMNVSASFMKYKGFLDFLYDDKEVIVNQLIDSEEDKAKFREFIEGSEKTQGYEFIREITERGDAWKAWVETMYPVLNGLAENVEPINILLGAYAMRIKSGEIAERNRRETRLPKISAMREGSDTWLVEDYQEIPASLQERYSIFNSSYYPPYAYHYFLAVDYTGIKIARERALAKVNAYIMFAKSGIFTAKNTTHFSLRSKNNSLSSESAASTTDKFQIQDSVYTVGAFNVNDVGQLGDSVTIRLQNGQNITFTIRGPTSKAKAADYLRDNPAILQAAISRSESLKYDGTLNENITVILADKYDYLAGDHKQNNIIILNASDLEAMLAESPVFVSEFITSLLSEELAHERGADGRNETEEKLALDAGYNTKTALKSQANPRPLSEYIKFVETIGLNIEGEAGYLNYLKALNRYEDLDWTARNAPLVNNRTVVVAHMEMGLSKTLLGNLYRKLISEKGYSEQAAELEVGEIAKLTMAGGLGNIKRGLTEAWSEKGADLVSMNILYGKWIKGIGNIDEDAVRHLIEMFGSPEMEFEVEIFDINNIWQKIKTKVSIYRDPFSPFPNYWIYCPDIFDGAYPEGDEHCAQQILLYRKAGLRLLEELRKQGKVKDKFLFSLSEVYTALLIPNAVKDEFKDSPVFKDVFIHHYNHTVVPAGMRKLDSHLHDFIGLNSERYGYSIMEWDEHERRQKIALAKIIGREADMITGCSMAHTNVLRRETMRDFEDKIPDNISEENSEGVYLDNWQGEEIQKIIAKYYVRLGARDDADLFRRLDNSAGLREQFIDDFMSAIEKQKNKSVLWFNREDVDLNKDSALISLTRRIVSYKKLDLVVEMLKNPAYREKFIKLGISIIVGGRKFDRDEQDFGITQIRTLEKLVEKYPELKKCVAIVLDDSRHAGYNIFIAPRIYTSVDSTIMLSDKDQEAGPTGPSKGLVNGAAMIATLDGVIPELLVPFNSETQEGNGFRVEYDANGQPSVESLFKALEDFSAVYKDMNLRRSLAYNALKTGMLKANISTHQGPGLENIWERGLREKLSQKFDKDVQGNLNALRTHWESEPEAFTAERTQSNVERILERMQSDPDCFIGFGDMSKIGVMNYVFTREVVDKLIPTMISAADFVLAKYNGFAVRIGGDEACTVLPSDLSWEDVNRIRLEVQQTLAYFIDGKYGFAKIENMSDERMNSLNDALRLETKDPLVKAYKDKDGFFIIYDKSNLADLPAGLIKPGAPVFSIPSPRLSFGIVKAENRNQDVHANYGQSIDHAEYILNISKENRLNGATSQSLEGLDKFKEAKSGIPRLSDEEKVKIAEKYSKLGIQLFADDIEEYYPVVKREKLCYVLGKMSSAGIGTTILIRGPPDNFYVITRVDDERIRFMKLEFVYEPYGNLKEDVSRAIERGRFTPRDLRERHGGYGFKVINEFYDHSTANRVILGINNLLNQMLKRRKC
ncbi:MAG: glycogen/starch/alpha-glucan phosphorylase [Candidatus Omnitrophica bacterium]|nr:glycogen/starch/alpha-glucan phosphorylase [Candidatus Omnitrophota bacterium]